eukprot:TRINITY_DN4052_c0_g1_i4.p1 TRINITY_DN4052_c0_g1~~TRINITY_DN4052_c0_g1_i4.p1  ORF type:complete len:324 (-),score=79.61 TRINITY_DN4052_c0_g1_i4:681-1652(-)
MQVARRLLYPTTPVLTREYIGEVLYAPKHGYFNNTTKRILSPTEPFDFLSFEDEQGYRTAVSELYKSGAGTWTTPVELFHPHYSASIGRWGVRQAVAKPEEHGLHFVEIGGGSGTCAVGVLSFLQEEHPEVYKNSSYTIVELSEELSKLQTAKFQNSGHAASIPCHVVQESGLVMDPSNWPSFDSSRKNICVVALEVLDNMPHDKVVRRNDSGEMFEVHVVSVDGELEEELHPISDSVIKELLEIIPESMLLKPIETPSKWLNFISDDIAHQDIWTEIFVPSDCYRFLKNLHDKFPNHHVLLADFHYLSEVIDGVRAPAVRSF